MKLRVSMTSRRLEAEPPCPEAVLETVVDGGFTSKRWTLELDSLESLVEFAKQNGGRLVLSFSSYPSSPYDGDVFDPEAPGELTLEIYDDWRE